ncbi:MAG: hypothetical protein ACREQ2_22240 [Candidatus Binatia bacterium]
MPVFTGMTTTRSMTYSMNFSSTTLAGAPRNTALIKITVPWKSSSMARLDLAYRFNGARDQLIQDCECAPWRRF